MTKNYPKFIMLAIMTIFIFASLFAGQTSVNAATSSTYKVTAKSLNARSGPSTSKKIVFYLKKDNVVTKTAASGKWFKIKYGKKTGWVSSSYLKKVTVVKTTSVSTPKNTTYFYITESTGLSMRNGASTSYNKLNQTVPFGAKVKIIQKHKNGWIKVTYNKKTGWINADTKYGFSSEKNIVLTGKAPTNTQKVVVKDKMYVRALPTTLSAKLTFVNKGFTAQILQVTSTNWAQIKFADNQKGWISLATSGTTVQNTTVQQISSSTEGSLKGIQIVLDAGHGNQDSGAVGTLNGKSITEKHLNLEAAKVMKQAIETVGGSVYMTRESDTFLSLETRAKYASKKGANAFISIHHNASSSTASGYETLYYDKGSNPKNSKAFAEAIHDNVMEAIEEEYTNVKDRGLKHQNVHVLRENTVFATLLELGFISNKTELERVNSTKYREAVAQGVVNGLLEYYGRD